MPTILRPGPSLPVMPQHLEALGRANAARSSRAALKKSVKIGETSFLVALEHAVAQEIEIGDLVAAQPRWAKNRAMRHLLVLQINPAKRVRELTDRQRDLLAGRA